MTNQTSFFLETSHELRRLFENGFTTKQLARGEVLFAQDQFDDQLYVLDEGLLEVSVYSVSGRKLSLNRLGPESVFGEIAMFDPGPRTAQVEALEPSKVRAIRKSTLVAALASEPHLAEELLSLAGKRLRWMSMQMEEQVFLSPASRLAAKMLHLAGDTDKIHVTQAQMADYVGVTRELVSKTLSEWRRDGIVVLTRGCIKLHDIDALTNIKNSDFY
jgi:CRP/FNR family cyclic AMP-dependent transcriptional regulator